MQRVPCLVLAAVVVVVTMPTTTMVKASDLFQGDTSSGTAVQGSSRLCPSNCQNAQVQATQAYMDCLVKMNGLPKSEKKQAKRTCVQNFQTSYGSSLTLSCLPEEQTHARSQSKVLMRMSRVAARQKLPPHVFDSMLKQKLCPYTKAPTSAPSFLSPVAVNQEACCKAAEKPLQCFEGIACCPDGTWSCSIGDGRTFTCSGVSVENPNGKVCNDDTLKAPPTPNVVAAKAPTLSPTLAPSSTPTYAPSSTPTYAPSSTPTNVPSSTPTNVPSSTPTSAPSSTPSSSPSDVCCDPLEEPGQFGNPVAPEGYACCPNTGEWTVETIGQNPITFLCGTQATNGPFGEACSLSADVVACCDPLEEPGKFGNPLGREGYACCPNGEWTTNNLGDGKTFFCKDNEPTTGPFGEACPFTRCPDDEDVCYDGVTTVQRDLAKNCEFADCPEIVFCTREVKPCPDGRTFVSRNPKLDCDFDPCPVVPCTDDAKICPNGVTTVSRNPKLSCEFDPCPAEKCCDVSLQPPCIEGAACCPDGTWSCSIGDGKTFTCNGQTTTGPFGQTCRGGAAGGGGYPTAVKCGKDLKVCPDGTLLARKATLQCEYPTCPTNTARAIKPKPPTAAPPLVVCTTDVKDCPDGSFVSRDSSNNCEFQPCPTISTKTQQSETSSPVFCAADVKQCPDGSFVHRNSANNCQFQPCSPDEPTKTCCPRKDFPLCFVGTAECCPNDGTWSCPNGNALEYRCGGSVVTTGPFGEECPEKEEEEKEEEDEEERLNVNLTGRCGTDAWQCPDGTLVYRDVTKNCEFPPCQERRRMRKRETSTRS